MSRRGSQTRPNGIDAREYDGPVFRTDVLHSIHAHRGVEHAVERQFLERGRAGTSGGFVAASCNMAVDWSTPRYFPVPQAASRIVPRAG